MSPFESGVYYVGYSFYSENQATVEAGMKSRNADALQVCWP